MVVCGEGGGADGGSGGKATEEELYLAWHIN
jgi:hypothetical protein